jgi:hypothetical protein
MLKLSGKNMVDRFMALPVGQGDAFFYQLYSDLLRILKPSQCLSQPKRRNLWLSAINAASRIREIATGASHFGK